MEILAPPISKQDIEPWFRSEMGGCPSRPEVREENESDELVFIHPAEKPQGSGPVYRANLYETL
jgi:hypothetical protein